LIFPLSQLLAALRAELVAFADFGIAAGAAAVAHGLVGGVDEAGGDDAAGDGDEGVAQEHDEAAEEAADGGDGRDVAVAYGAEGGDGPVDAGADVLEGAVGFSALDDEHEGAEADDKHEDEEEIDGYLVEAAADGLEQHLAFVEEGEEAEDAEDAEEADATQDEHVARAGEEVGEIGWQHGQQVDDAPSAEGIAAAALGAVEAGEVFDGEDDGEQRFEGSERDLQPEG